MAIRFNSQQSFLVRTWDDYASKPCWKEDKFNNRQDALDILISAKSMGFNSYMRAVV